MRLLLDTHAFLWWITDSPKLSTTARKAIINGATQVYWSTASTWEISIKFSLGRLPLPAAPQHYIPSQLEINGFTSLPITDQHAYVAASLPKHHADPFDRMLVAQAQVEYFTLVSADQMLKKYDTTLIW